MVDEIWQVKPRIRLADESQTDPTSHLNHQRNVEVIEFESTREEREKAN